MLKKIKVGEIQARFYDCENSLKNSCSCERQEWCLAAERAIRHAHTMAYDKALRDYRAAEAAALCEFKMHEREAMERVIAMAARRENAEHEKADKVRHERAELVRRLAGPELLELCRFPTDW